MPTESPRIRILRGQHQRGGRWERRFQDLGVPISPMGFPMGVFRNCPITSNTKLGLDFICDRLILSICQVLLLFIICELPVVFTKYKGTFSFLLLPLRRCDSEEDDSRSIEVAPTAQTRTQQTRTQPPSQRALGKRPLSRTPTPEQDDEDAREAESGDAATLPLPGSSTQIRTSGRQKRPKRGDDIFAYYKP